MKPVAIKLPITRASVNTPVRSIVKTVTWRILAELDTFVVGYVLTGSLRLSLSIVGIESATKTVLYYLHERAWGHVAWGIAHLEN